MKRLFILLLGLSFCHAGFAWGPKGHDVTAYIAECNLTPEAAEQIDRVLDGYSIVYYANWLDTASHTPEYEHTKTWHYANIDHGYTYFTMPKNPNGDVVRAIDSLSADLKSRRLDPQTEKIQLIMLVHLMGDLHCPMHSGHLDDIGGNTWRIRFFGKETDLHSAWDSALPESVHAWSYTEWQNQLDRLPDQERMLISAGTPLEWFLESNDICRKIYEMTPQGSDIDYDYLAQVAPIIEVQFIRAGYRLARLLNEIYD